MTDIPMRVVMSVIGGNAIAGAFGQIASTLGPAGVVGAALVGFGVSSVQVSAGFQNAMLQNEAHAGLAADQVQAVNRALLQMGPAVGQGPTQLAEALYPILSGFSGISNQAAKTQVSLTELRLAAQSVAGSTTSVTTVSNAATASFNALGLATNNTSTNVARMNWLFDVMNTTVSSGNMHWQDYANVAGKLATAIKGTGVSFVEANAALATMTNEGFSAQRSETYLANLFTQLDLKTDSMAKHAAKLGIAFDEQKFKTMSLAQQVDYLNKITHGNQSELLALLGGNSTALKTFNALESGMKSYKNNLDALNHSHGATAQAFAVASQGYNFALARLGASFQSLQISVGNIFLPMLTALINAMVPVISGLASWIAANQGVTNSIANASTGMLPTMRHLRDMAMDLYQVLAYWLLGTMPTLRQQFQLTSNLVLTQFLPALQSTGNWMLSPGMPIYAQFAKMVRDLLGGSFRQARLDAIQMGLTILQVLQGIPAHLAHLNFSQIFSQIFKFRATGSASPLLDILGLFGLLPAIQRLFQPILDWLGNVFGPVWHAIFDPVAAEFQQVVMDLTPYVQQFQMFWSSLFGPQQQGSMRGFGDTLKNFGDAWKQALSVIGQIFEFLFKLGLQLLMIILPPIIAIGEGIAWLFLNGVGPAVEFLSAALDMFYTGLNGVWTWINNTLYPWISFAVSMIQQGWQAIIQGVGDFVASVIQWFADLYNYLLGHSIIPDIILGITGWFASLPGRVFGLVSNFASGVASRFRGLWTTLLHDAQSILGGLGSSVVGIFRNAVNGLISAINGFIRGLDSISINVPGIGQIGFNIPQLPYVASGGIARRPGLAVVGEAGAEIVALPAGAAVYPHGSAPAGYGGGITQIFYISIATMARSQAEVQRLVDMIEQEIGHRTFGQTPGYTLI